MNPRPADYKSAALPTELHRHDRISRRWLSRDADYYITTIPVCQHFFENIFSIIFQVRFYRRWVGCYTASRYPFMMRATGCWFVRIVSFREGKSLPYMGDVCFVFLVRVYQTVSIHLIRQAAPATFPVQGKAFCAVIV